MAGTSWGHCGSGGGLGCLLFFRVSSSIPTYPLPSHMLKCLCTLNLAQPSKRNVWYQLISTTSLNRQCQCVKNDQTQRAIPCTPCLQTESVCTFHLCPQWEKKTSFSFFGQTCTFSLMQTSYFFHSLFQSSHIVVCNTSFKSTLSKRGYCLKKKQKSPPELLCTVLRSTSTSEYR